MRQRTPYQKRVFAGLKGFWAKGTGLRPPHHGLNARHEIECRWFYVDERNVETNTALAALIDYATEQQLEVKWIFAHKLPDWKRLARYAKLLASAKVLVILIPKEVV